MSAWIVLTLAGIAFLVLFRDKIQSELHEARTDLKSWLKKMWKEWGEPFLVAALIALVIRSFVLGPYKIPTGSMRPTLLEGDRIFVDKVTYRFRAPGRGEIIVFKYPLDLKKDFVKRLIAFPGEEVEIKDGTAFINGKPFSALSQTPIFYYSNRNDWAYGKEGQKFTVPEGAFFVLGDNSGQSSDSRNWGFVPRKNVVGKAFLIWWPFGRFGFLR